MSENDGTRIIPKNRKRQHKVTATISWELEDKIKIYAAKAFKSPSKLVALIIEEWVANKEKRDECNKQK